MPKNSNKSANSRFQKGLAFRDIDISSVVDSVRAVDPIGSGVGRIARRVDAGIRNRKAGFHDGRPLTLLLTSGCNGEPGIVAKAIAESLLGVDMDGAPLVHIQAEHYIGPGGDLLVPLLGPQAQGALAPLLDAQRLFSPYVLNRVGRELQPLQFIIQKLEAAAQTAYVKAQQLADGGNQQMLNNIQNTVQPGIYELYREATKKRSDMLDSVSPNLAVIYISGLERLIDVNGSRDAQAFRQLLRRMCVDGYAEVRGTGRTELQDCIIIGSYQAPDVAGNDDENSQDTFRRIIGVLSSSVTGREIIDNFGGERSVIVLNAPTEETQAMRLTQKMQSLQLTLKSNFDIVLLWESAIFEYVLQRSTDPDIEGNYPSPRLDARFDELVIGTVAELVLAEGLTRNMRITLSMVGNTPGIRVNASNVSEEDAPISSNEVRKVFSRETPITIVLTPEVQEIQSRLAALLDLSPSEEEDTTQSGFYL